MKYLILACSFLLSIYSFAGPGDTLEIQSHQDVVIKTNPSVGHTDYPEWVEFPNLNMDVYKLYAYLTFECAPGLNCGEWDYLNYINVGRTGGVNGSALNWEIARFITPYGNYWNAASNWKHGWYYDLTDFASILRDSIEIIYRHTGYEANHDRGWKINLTFFAIEGQPYEEIIDISRLWNGSFQYGNPANPIEDKLDPRQVTLNGQTETASLKIIQTGHGFNNNENCAEFCPKIRTIKKNGASFNQRLIWRDCGFNSLYPQAGTWLYDRGNWCPGATVIPDDVDLGAVSGGNTYTLDIDMQPYTDNGNYGNYVFNTYLLEYKEPTYTNDVSLESVIAPSDAYEHLRFNPICGTPMLEIRNNGKNLLSSLTVKYGVPGHTIKTYQWSGSLDFKAIDTIYIAESIDWSGFNGELYFELENPNGETDEFPHNNSKTVEVTEPPTVTGSGIILFYLTNKAASENYYLIRDMEDGSVVFSKNNLQNSSLHRDTIPLIPGRCYQLEFYDDGPFTPGLPALNEDGLSWWANSADGSGFVRVLNGHGGTIEQFNPDFGEKILYQFRVDYDLAAPKPLDGASYVEVHPNPARDHVQIHFEMYEVPDFVEILDVNGNRIELRETEIKSGMVDFDVSQVPRGIYLVRLVGNSGWLTRKVIIH